MGKAGFPLCDDFFLRCRQGAGGAEKNLMFEKGQQILVTGDGAGLSRILLWSGRIRDDQKGVPNVPEDLEWVHRGGASEPEKKTILMGHKISSFYAPSTQVFSHLFYFDRIKFL